MRSAPGAAAAPTPSALVACAGTASPAAGEHPRTPEAARWPASLPMGDAPVEAEAVAVLPEEQERHTTVHDTENQWYANAVFNKDEMNAGGYGYNYSLAEDLAVQ